MNNREEWSQTEQDLEKMLEKIRKEYPDFWAEEPELPRDCKAGMERFREEQAKKRRRRALIAACCTFCILGSTALTLFVNSDTAHAMKFALEKKYYEVNGMISATDPDRVSDENTISVTITDEKLIADCKKFWDGVVTLEYVPDGYQFKKLEVIKHLNGLILANYLYENEEAESFTVTIRTFNEEQNVILWTTSKEVRDGTCEYRIWEDEIAQTKGIDVIFPGRILVACGYLEKRELICLVNGLK